MLKFVESKQVQACWRFVWAVLLPPQENYIRMAMLRALFIFLSKAGWARTIVMRWSFAWRMASRFIAGETLDDAIRVVKALNAKGINASLDQLGEHTETVEDAARATAGILKMFPAIQQSGVRANVSIKLSQIGMTIDMAACRENLRQILACAREYDSFVRIDMEDTPWTDITLDLWREMRAVHGLTNAGIVIQAYLYRSEEDIRSILEQQGQVRLCKGAYQEPAEVAFPKKADVDANYDKLSAMLIDGSLAMGAPQLSQEGRIPPIPAIASHDPKRLLFAKQYAEKAGLPKQALEFQMLFGIRRDLQEAMAQEDYPVRVYVPFGTQWYPYFMRRLAERPANVWFLISNFFRK